jgi:tetratricopeptide (TPR) repeat protein
VHRDFKPDNAMIGNDGRVRVLDFGLARAAGLDSEKAESPSDSQRTPSLLGTSLTQAGAVLGTPRFMPPEQLRGEATDERADQFSFCVSLYWALYGRFPFVGGDDQELLENVLSGRLSDPPPGATVPRWLRQAIARGLMPRPADRYPSMDALLQALRQDPSRVRLRWLAAAVGLLALAGAVGLARWSARDRGRLCQGAAARLSGVWDAERKQRLERAFEATGNPLAKDSFERAAAVLDRYASAWQAMHVSACEATRVRGEQSDAVLSLRMACLERRLGDLRALTHLYEAADPELVTKAVEVASSLPSMAGCGDVAALTAGIEQPRDAAQKAKSEDLLARLSHPRLLKVAGRYAEAAAQTRPLAEAARALGYAPTSAEVLDFYAEVKELEGELEESEGLRYEALADAIAGHHERMTAQVATNMIWLHGVEQAHREDGHHWAEVARAAIRRIGGNDDLEADVEHYESQILYEAGQYDAALKHNELSLKARERVYGADDQRVAINWVNAGNILSELHALPDARAAFERAIQMYERALGPEHPKVGLPVHDLGLLELEAGNYDRALALFARSLALHEKLGAEHNSVGWVLSDTADALVKAGRPEQALEMHTRALAILEKGFRPGHPYIAQALQGIGDDRLALHQPALAVPFIERALAIRRSLAIEPKLLGDTLSTLARALRDSGDRSDRPRTLAEEAIGQYRKCGRTRTVAELERWLDRMHR